MKLEIYRILEKDSYSFLKEEVCRACAEKELKKGYEIEFDKHLSKYIYSKEGISYYSDGEVTEALSCSICDSNFEGKENEQLLN